MLAKLTHEELLSNLLEFLKMKFEMHWTPKYDFKLPSYTQTIALLSERGENDIFCF